MNHLNEDMLIQYAFDLAEPQDRETAQRHLDECGDCRNALAAIKVKFSAMDTLAGEVPPSEELIQRTMILQNKAKAIPLYRRRWVEWSAAAAAVVLICFLMLQNLPDTRFVSSPPAKGQYPEGGRGLFSSAQEKDNFGTAKNNHPGLAATPPFKGGELIRIVSADEIPDTPPFAPASAIELVVLPTPDKTQVTIYNSADLTLVRDTRKLTLKPGWNWLQFMWDGTLIDPTSLSLTPLEYTDKIDIQQLVYPARLKDIGRWLIRSEVEGAVPFEITYFASGLSWRAFYMGTMNEDETTMDLKGYVNVSNNSGQDFVNTQTRLIVGQTRLTEDIRTLAQRRYPYGPDIIVDDESSTLSYGRRYNWRGIEDKKVPLLGDMPTVDGLLNFDGDSAISGGVYFKYDIKQIEKTGLSEYFLYSIEGTEDLKNQWTKRLPSFDIENVPVKSLYKYDEDRYGNAPVRFVSFANDTEHELGETPIPEGSIKIYRNVNELHNLSYVGQSSIKYIPVNEDIELNLGAARLVKIEPLLVEQKTDNYTFDNQGNINGWDDIQTWQVKTTNTRDIPVDIEITRNFGTDAWELELSRSVEGLEYKKHDKSHARFTLTVPAKTETTFEHTITLYQGRRTEAYIEKMKERQQ